MALVTIVHQPGQAYPTPDQHSPDTRYPEYPFAELAPGPNGIYPQVRQCLADAGADAGHYQSAAWNPLGDWLKRGERVFILPNLVTHRRPEESSRDFWGKCIHGSVLRALMDYVFLAVGDLKLISFGNASLQSCDYGRVSRDTGAAAVGDFYRRIGGLDLGPIDLRAVASTWTRFGAMLQHQARPVAQVAVDLGRDSLLEELYRSPHREVRFRVGDYDPAETMSYHAPGKHVYLVNRRVLESRVIISLPKLKTHQKVGITCALKGTVGAIARKECLAHHRKGGPADQGDEFPLSSLLHRFTSDVIDRGAKPGTGLKCNAVRVSGKALKRLLRLGPRGVSDGAWYGNDTAWRMTLDIARILRYARPDGTLSPTPQREHLALVDGVMAGEGEGPLTPKGRPAGIVLFSPEICWADYACALLMGFDPFKIPLVRQALGDMAYPLTRLPLEQVQFRLNGINVTPAQLPPAAAQRFSPPKGWRGQMEI